MTMLNPLRALGKIYAIASEQDARKIGAHVFYYASKDMFSVTKGCQNRASIDSRIQRNNGDYCGFYTYGATPDMVRDDIDFIRRKVKENQSALAAC